MSELQPVRRSIDVLRQYRSQHGFRAKTLLPDLALIGLTDDLTDAADTALELVESTRPYRAYMMARVAFEAAQRLLVLGTAADYVTLGTRAWVYYQEKDSEFRPSTSSKSAESGEAQTIAVWTRYVPEAP